MLEEVFAARSAGRLRLRSGRRPIAWICRPAKDAWLSLDDMGAGDAKRSAMRRALPPDRAVSGKGYSGTGGGADGIDVLL
jgi:hypothetical protein